MTAVVVILVVALGITIFVAYKNAKKTPVFNLAKFEKAAKTAVQKFGPDSAKTIVGTIRLTTDVMGVNFTAEQEAKNAITENLNAASNKKKNAAITLTTGEKVAQDLENQATLARAKAKETASQLTTAAATAEKRAEELEDLLDLM
jgi:hypothetical protein